MAKSTIKNYTLYKLRFWIGYTLLALTVLGVFTFATLYVPGGITPKEQQSALTSASIDFSQPSSFLMIDMPYHVLQKLSIHFLQLNSFAIKLPSLLIGFATAVILTLLLRRRLSQTPSIIAAGILVISAQFIALVATGTPGIMMVFWPSLLLLIATYATKNKELRPAAIYIASIVVAFALFTPFMLPIVAALCVAAIAHPRFRYMLRKTSSSVLATSSIFVLASLAIIGYASYLDILFAKQLLYRSADSFSTDILANLQLLAYQIGDFTATTTETTELLAPVFALTTLVFASIGAYHLFRWRHSALSYVTVLWILAVTPVVILNPSTLQLYIVPFALLIASGVSAVMSYWYRLFPKNPYARIFALVPVTILFTCIIFAGAARYFYSFHYYAPLANQSSQDTEIVARELAASPDAVLLVAEEERSWYRLYLDTHNNTHTTLATDTSQVSNDGTITQDTIATHKSSITASGVRPTRVIASSELTAASDRVYIYKKTEK